MVRAQSQGVSFGFFGGTPPNLIHLVYEYRRLLARRELMDGQLSRSSALRLDALERLFGREPSDVATEMGLLHRRRHARCEVRLPATIKLGARVQAVDITSLGGGGLRVEPAPPLRPGERAVVRIVSLDTGSIYHYPVIAGWSQRSRSTSSMGLCFAGVPRQLSLAA